MSTPYLVTVIAARRRGRGVTTVNIKTFERDDANRRWVYHPGRRLTKKLDGTGANVDNVISAMLSQDHGRLASAGTVWSLGRDFRIPVHIANVIFDALRADKRHRVDIDDMKTVVSQLGSQISGLGQLPAEHRRRAEQALCTLILGRCTNLG